VRIAVLEHFSALPAGEAPPALLSAGRALLRAVAADLAALPGVTADVVTGFHDGDAGFVRTLGRCDAALVVAPEEGGVLERLVRIAGKRRLLLGPGPVAVRLATDKRAMSRRLMRRGIAVPAGAVVRRRGAAARLRGLEAPFVVKPRDGCGCEGVSIVRWPQGVEAALRRIDRASRRRDLLVEEYVPGEPASVSFLVSRGGDGSRTPQTLCLGLNRQSVRGRGPLRYAGGETPWRHPLAGEALRLAARAVAVLGQGAADLCGYVGVDLVLGRDGPRVVEVNPRLTTAYLGLRRVTRVNLAGLMLDAALGRRLPEHLEVEGRCSFRPDGSVLVRGARRVAAS
jgi:predicted ATP-grasp superfamily ATP-dependent carboligase